MFSWVKYAIILTPVRSITNGSMCSPGLRISDIIVACAIAVISQYEVWTFLYLFMRCQA